VLSAGVDAGSRAVKAVLLDGGSGAVLGRGVVDQSPEPDRQAGRALEACCSAAGRRPAEVDAVVATGYARDRVGAARTTVTEITCHARGVHHQAPAARTVVEIGGQDSKLLRLEPDGSVRDFAMNDRCAAGTGRFLEMVAQRLEAPLAALAELAPEDAEPIAISSMCVVFAETEIVGLLADGAPPARILAGVQQAVARRVAGMAGGRVEPPVAFTGGVALVPGMAAALARALACEVRCVEAPQYTGALGAALVAAERAAR
jgi:predicted CoA-substrate-specific enzyme activase